MGGKQNILFVDDEPNFLNGLRRMLREHRHEWEMHFAESADEALALTDKVEYDSVVSDVQMPGKTGFDLLIALRKGEATKAVPVVILTGNAEVDMKRKALQLGATDLLNKPVNTEDLVARIRSVLRLKTYQDELKNQNVILEQKVRDRTAELEFLHRDIVWRLAKAGELRDEETGDHVIRVANYCRILAEHLDLDKETVETIFLTAPLHDLGKIGIPDNILLKPGKLDAEEWRIMKTHAEIGSKVLLEEPKGMSDFIKYHGRIFEGKCSPDVDIIRNAAAIIALSHHEKWDGSGYPKGLVGEDIPLNGRIVALADVYDALRSDRPYKKAFSPEKTLAIIEEGAGSHFDPRIFEIFVKVRDEFEGIRQKYSD